MVKSIKLVPDKVMEFICNQMVKNLMAIGKMDSCQAKVCKLRPMEVFLLENFTKANLTDTDN